MRAIRTILVSVAVACLASPGRPDAVPDPVVRQYLEKEGFRWQSKQTEHFRLFFEPGSDARRYLAALRRNVEQDRANVLKLIGAEGYDPLIYAFFLGSGAQMKELVGVEVNGRSRPVQHAVFSVITPDRLHLTHELCHEIVSNLWGAAEPWIEEGLATFADEGTNVYYDSWTLLESGSLIPLDKLVGADWNSSMYSADITYTELGGFVKYLHDAYGVERLKQVWQGGAASIPQVLGKPLPEIEREWRESLTRQFPARPTRHYRSGLGGVTGWIE